MTEVNIDFFAAVERLTGDTHCTRPLRVIARNDPPIELQAQPEVRRARAMWAGAGGRLSGQPNARIDANEGD